MVFVDVWYGNCDFVLLFFGGRVFFYWDCVNVFVFVFRVVELDFDIFRCCVIVKLDGDGCFLFGKGLVEVEVFIVDDVVVFVVYYGLCVFVEFGDVVFVVKYVGDVGWCEFVGIQVFFEIEGGLFDGWDGFVCFDCDWFDVGVV